MLLSFLIGGDGSFLGIVAPCVARDVAPLHDEALEVTAVALDMEPSLRGEPLAAGGSAVFYARIANRAPAAHAGVCMATLSDAHGTDVAGRALQNGWYLEPGAATRIAFGFALPAEFVPHHLVLRPIRVAIE